MNNKKKPLKMKFFLHTIAREESGAVVVFIAAAMAIFMALLALSVDIGLAYLNAGTLQKAADAAVYSAGRKLPVKDDDTAKINAIKDSAIYYAQQNGYHELVRDDVVLENYLDGYYTAIKVSATMNVATNFARIFGINSVNIKRSAKTKLSPAITITGAAPLGLPKEQLDLRIESGDTTHVVLKYGSGSGSQGFFGVLDLDGSKGGGASDYRRWLAQGYPGETTVGDILLYGQGNMVGPTFQGFSERYDACTHYGASSGGTGCTVEHYDPSCPRVAKVVIYAVDSSSTATVWGFSAFLLEHQTQDGYITGSFVNTITPGGTSGADAGSSGDYGVYNLMLSE